MVGKETNLSLLNSFSIIKKIRIVKTELLTMNVTLDIYMFFNIMIIVLIIYYFSSLQERIFKVCHSKENCVMDDMHF